MNAWSNPSRAGAVEAANLAQSLEERSARLDQVQINAAVCEVLAAQPGERLLEVGSGTGAVSRVVASTLAPEGCVVGLDISPEFSSLAKQLTDAASPAVRISHITGRGEYLPFRDSAFDAAWAVRSLLHISDPQGVIGEMKRVVARGGRIVLADWDFETVVVDHSDRELTRRILNWRTDHQGGDQWSGRKLFGRACRAGLNGVRVTPVVSFAHQENASLTQSLWNAADLALKSEVITVEEYDAWVGELKERIRSGCFFSSIVYFVVTGRN